MPYSPISSGAPHPARRREIVLNAVRVGKELPERIERRRREPAGGQVRQRPAEVRIVVRAEEPIEDPARRPVLADLLREGVLVEVEEDEDAAPLAEPDARS